MVSLALASETRVWRERGKKRPGETEEDEGDGPRSGLYELGDPRSVSPVLGVGSSQVNPTTGRLGARP